MMFMNQQNIQWLGMWFFQRGCRSSIKLWGDTQAKFETVMYLGERSWDSWTDHEQGKDLPP